MTALPADLQKILDGVGADNELREYLQKRGIDSVAVMAALGVDMKEAGDILVGPLESGFELASGKVFKLDPLQVPVTRARLRQAWKECDQLINGGERVEKPAPSTVATVSPSKPLKDLPNGYWQAQIEKYQATCINGERRKFPQEVLIGAEQVLARIVGEMKSGTFTAIGLHEIVEARYFNAAGEPNPLSAARKKSRPSATVLAINADHQLEAEPEVPWHPKSVLAMLDCVEAVKVALIFVEFTSETVITNYCEWFSRQVRAKPNKLDQLRVYWESAWWKIAFAMRAKAKFQDIAAEIMADNQALQEAMNREIAVEKPKKTRLEYQYLDRYQDGKQGGKKGGGKGKRFGGKQQPWQQWNDGRWRSYDGYYHQTNKHGNSWYYSEPYVLEVFARWGGPEEPSEGVGTARAARLRKWCGWTRHRQTCAHCSYTQA